MHDWGVRQLPLLLMEITKVALSGKRGWNSEKGYKGGSFVVLRKVEGVFSPFGERSCPLQTQSGRSNHGPQDTCLSLVFPVWHGMVSLPTPLRSKLILWMVIKKSARAQTRCNARKLTSHTSQVQGYFLPLIHRAINLFQLTKNKNASLTKKKITKTHRKCSNHFSLYTFLPIFFIQNTLFYLGGYW